MQMQNVRSLQLSSSRSLSLRCDSCIVRQKLGSAFPAGRATPNLFAQLHTAQRHVRPISLVCKSDLRDEEQRTAILDDSNAPAHAVDDRTVPVDAELLPPTSRPGKTGKTGERWGLASEALTGLSRPQTALFGLAAGAGLLGSGFDVAGPGSIVQALLVLAGIVAFHEAGHFTAARAQGIHVSKFSIGFGPALWKYQNKEVEYSLRAIPLGGFVAFPDDDPESDIPPDDPDLLRNRNIPQRLLVISAGIIANIILAYGVLLTQVATVGTPSLDFLPGVIVPEVIGSSAGYRAGVKAGDVFVGINGQALTPSVNNVKRVVDIIRDNPGREVMLTIQRGEDAKPFDLAVTPDLAPRDSGGVIGVKLGAHAKIKRVSASGPVDALQRAGAEFNRLGSQITNGLKQILFNFSSVQDKISGPVAIVVAGSEVARTDSSGLYQFAALVSLNLAVVNAFPLPGLDGGYIAFLALEAARGKKLQKEVEAYIMGTGLLLLTGVGVLMVVRDAIHLSGG